MRTVSIYKGKIAVKKDYVKRIQRFEILIIILIILSSIVMCLDNPLLDPDSVYRQVLFWLDFFFTLLFIVEATLKIIALGFFFNRMPELNSYIMNPWNILDFIVVICSIINFIFSFSQGDSSALQTIKILRMIRAL